MGEDRRSFLLTTVACGLALVVPMPAQARGEGAVSKAKEAEPGISAPEDLMREHGVLNRILLVYEEGVRRLRAREEVPPEIFSTPAGLVRRFVEDYHEQLEEKFIFPRFDKAHALAGLVTVLREQHQSGRGLTDRVLRNATAGRLRSAEAREEVIRACEAFIRMYRPHEAREDTVLFPALYKVVPAKDIAELGERFEEEEHRLFGEDGFDNTVEHVAAIEKQLGIYDLAQFTPKS
jgi:hemerythrin-like domain-containing protein